MHSEKINRKSLHLIEGLVASAPYLPFAYIPGVTQKQAAALALDTIANGFGNEDTDVLLASESGGPAGMVVVEYLPWDSDVYGIPMGRVSSLIALPGAHERAAKDALVDAAAEVARKRKLAHLSCRVHARDLVSVHSVSAHGFRLMTTHAVYVWDLGQSLREAPKMPAAISDATEDDLDELRDVAARSYAPFTRFKVDETLPGDKTDALYARWVESACRGYGDLVQVARLDGTLVGYAAWKIHRETCDYLGVTVGDLLLTAIVPVARRKHIFTALVREGLVRLKERGVQFCEVHTHVLNTGAQRTYSGLDARILAARYAFHLNPLIA